MKKEIVPQAASNKVTSCAEIQDGTFATKWLQENRAGGRANFLAMRRLAQEHPIEKVGAELRQMMPWLRDKKELTF